jgi:hypothetical protein
MLMRRKELFVGRRVGEGGKSRRRGVRAGNAHDQEERGGKWKSRLRATQWQSPPEVIESIAGIFPINDSRKNVKAGMRGEPRANNCLIGGEKGDRLD